jgi:hypothetical protein
MAMPGFTCKEAVMAVETNDRQPCLKVSAPGGETFELYLLNAGESFRGFGGSRSGLLVTKTASLIIRHRNKSGMQADTEYDIADKAVWTTVAGWFNSDEIVAEGPEDRS